jgi:putative CocE/NonD family hydrolase
MDGDQRFAAARKDVLVYQTPPLDHDLTVAGPLTADCWVSISTTDADLVVKLIDVFPVDKPGTGPHRLRLPDDRPADDTALTGYQMLVRGDIFRGRYRNGLSNPQPFTPNQPTEVKFDLNDIAHTFRKGHRIMVQVQSSWFPLADRNPQRFVNIYQAKDSDFVPADITVWHDAAHPSRVILPVLR